MRKNIINEKLFLESDSLIIFSKNFVIKHSANPNQHYVEILPFRKLLKI